MKTTSYTGNRIYAFDAAPRCGARTKSNDGFPCRCPAIKGKKRCRLHGGAQGSGAPRGNVNAFKHGNTTATTKAFRVEVGWAIRRSKELLNESKN